MGEGIDDIEQDEETCLKRLLLNNCLHSNTNLSLNSMRLFEVCIQRFSFFLILKFSLLDF